MEQDENPNCLIDYSNIPEGWIGGFSEHPPGPYPNEALLTSLPFEQNLTNICELTRMLRAKWPEFSWEVTPGDPSTRMYQMFSPDISRLGYDDKGRVWSIICPQQGVYFESLGLTLNIEVTVTGNRGWINEKASAQEIFAADITIRPTLWFNPDDPESFVWQQLLKLNDKWSHQLPLSKANGIQLYSFSEDGATDIISVRMGEHPDYPFPERAKHWGDFAWTVAYLGVTIGSVIQHTDPKVNEFNGKVMELFNLGSGNLLQENTILVWNLWAGSPELVDREEWHAHADYWRHSIDVNHRPPEGTGTSIANFKGEPFNPSEIHLGLKVAEFTAWLAWQLL